MVSPNDDNDFQLVKRCQAGDKKAFESLVIKYEKEIFNLCYRMLLSPKRAEEAGQEAFMRVYKNIKKFRGESAFYTWLYKIAINLCLDILKKKRIKEILFSLLKKEEEDTRQPEEIFISEMDDPEKTYEKREIKERIRDAIAELNENHRAVVILIYYEGLGHKETAEILNEKLGTIKSRLNRALNILMEKLKDLRTNKSPRK